VVWGPAHRLPAARGRETVLLVAPGQDGEAGGQTAAGLGPAERAPAPPGQEVADAPHEPAVQGFGSVESLLGGAGAGGSRVLPLRRGALLAADVDIRRGEGLHDLVKDGAAEVEVLQAVSAVAAASAAAAAMKRIFTEVTSGES
jgi:hypothetical protein